jgi:hypothetical protein
MGFFPKQACSITGRMARTHKANRSLISQALLEIGQRIYKKRLMDIEYYVQDESQYKQSLLASVQMFLSGQADGDRTSITCSEMILALPVRKICWSIGCHIIQTFYSEFLPLAHRDVLVEACAFHRYG